MGAHPLRLMVLGVLALALALALVRCDARPQVVIYAALDQVFSQQVLAEFEAQTGIEVLAVYDTEATKTTGLVTRLRSESKNPRCDVFWNNEILRTIRLAREGLLTSYVSPAAADIPPRFKDPDGLWTGFAARARAIAYDPTRVAESALPRSHADLLDPRWRGQVVLADPRFGTTGSHLAFLFALWGEKRGREFLQGLANNKVAIVGGNSTSRDRVVSGQALLGLTDTDDIEVVQRRGVSIGCGLYENEGTVLLPNTVALVRGGPHPEAARRLIDFLLSPDIEKRLAASPSRQIPVRASVEVPETGLRLDQVRVLDVSFSEAADHLEAALRAAQEILR